MPPNDTRKQAAEHSSPSRNPPISSLPEHLQERAFSHSDPSIPRDDSLMRPAHRPHHRSLRSANLRRGLLYTASVAISVMILSSSPCPAACENLVQPRVRGDPARNVAQHAASNSGLRQAVSNMRSELDKEMQAEDKRLNNVASLLRLPGKQGAKQSSSGGGGGVEEEEAAPQKKVVIVKGTQLAAGKQEEAGGGGETKREETASGGGTEEELIRKNLGESSSGGRGGGEDMDSG
eukprot:CAMPEP_0181318112 /NCGR_PEP_ID=MMETSP1101-20121128/16831_1 /TAXON_ID=46948 /ORGANISM="Rhodomonas abbreviata, Strain Caron Lab Isolate" /LENGTH=234 /DNA_ID=CAMNT_0023425557 /DNA_START=109 /DNA_END=809 /DNA_ORIENTATION=+